LSGEIGNRHKDEARIAMGENGSGSISNEEINMMITILRADY